MDTETTLMRIRALNDAVRMRPYSGDLFVTRGISDLPWHEQADILARVGTFNDFTEDNDPHGEHDFGSFEKTARRSSGRSTTTICSSITARATRQTPARAHPHVRGRILIRELLWPPESGREAAGVLPPRCAPY